MFRLGTVKRRNGDTYIRGGIKTLSKISLTKYGRIWQMDNYILTTGSSSGVINQNQKDVFKLDSLVRDIFFVLFGNSNSSEWMVTPRVSKRSDLIQPKIQNSNNP